MGLIKLEKPNLKNVDAAQVYGKFIQERKKFFPHLENADSPEYLYWSDFKHKPTPDDLSAEELWVLLKLTRETRSTPTFVKDESGDPYRWVKLNRFERFLNQIDMHAAGNVWVPEAKLLEIGKSRESYIMRGILEEAIASSQLEGAHTTRSVAKKMLLEKRSPRNNSEQMILNNYLTIKKIEQKFKNSELSLDLLFELHSMLVKGTNVPEREQGRFRKDSDNIVVGDIVTGDIGHIPPKEAFLLPEIQRFIDIANDEESEMFLHPLVKAVFLHFWIGYLHPFTDGNGRLARAIFYWYMLRKGYWAMMYLPISTAIKSAPGQYRDAYLRSEQDDFDLTYFVDFHFRQIEKAVKAFQDYLEKKNIERVEINNKLGDKFSLNPRQRHVIYHLGVKPNESTTIITHQKINGISRLTATRDLNDLVKKGLLKKYKIGRTIHFSPTEKTTILFGSNKKGL